MHCPFMQERTFRYEYRPATATRVLRSLRVLLRQSYLPQPNSGKFRATLNSPKLGHEYRTSTYN